jgi:hypothetical protein
MEILLKVYEYRKDNNGVVFVKSFILIKDFILMLIFKKCEKINIILI